MLVGLGGNNGWYVTMEASFSVAVSFFLDLISRLLTYISLHP